MRTHQKSAYVPRPKAVLARHLSRVYSDILSQTRTLSEFDPAECDRREVILIQSVTRLRAGSASQDDVGELIDAANLAGFRIDNGEDFQQAGLTIFAAKTALQSLAETHETTGRFIARAHELSSLADFVDYYMAMMRASNAQEWHLARAKLIAAYQDMNIQNSAIPTPKETL